MTPSRPKPLSPPPAAPPSNRARYLTRAAFVILLLTICARVTLTEIVREVSDPVPGVAEFAPLAPGPAASLLLDLLCCIPAMLILARRALDPAFSLRFAWSHLPLALLAIWMALGVSRAGDKFAALIGVANSIAAFVVIWSACQLIRDWARFRLLAAAFAGIFFIYIAAGLDYRLNDLPLLRKDWQENRVQILRDRGIEPGSFEATQFGNKLLAGDVGCFSNSPNTYASALVLLAAVAAGLVIQRFANRDPVGWSIPILIAFPLGCFVFCHARSRTAAAMVLLAAILLFAIARLRNWLPSRVRRLYWIGLASFALGTAAVVGHGLAHNSFVDKSLTFRWYYWTGAAKLFASHPIAGVGWNNFGQHYLAVRGPGAVEEVQDPHNFLVKAFAELGTVGGLLMIAWIARLWWELTRPILPSPDDTASTVETTVAPKASACHGHPDRASARSDGPNAKTGNILILATLALLPMVLNFAIGVDWSQAPSWLLLQGFTRFIWAILLAAALVVGSLRALPEEKLDDRPSPWLLYAVLVGLAVFLLHNLVDFALSETAILFLFAPLVGAASGMRHPSPSPNVLAGLNPRTGRHGQDDRGTHRIRFNAALASLIAALALWLLAGAFIWRPTAMAESAAADGDAAVRAARFPQALAHYQRAMQSQPRNGDYARRAALALIHGRDSAAQVRPMLDAAIQANPFSVKYLVLKARFEQNTPPPNVQAIVDAYTAALNLDPRNIRLRLECADVLKSLNQNHQAAAQYRQALRYDAELPPDEPKRLSSQKRQDIGRKLDGLSKP